MTTLAGTDAGRSGLSTYVRHTLPRLAALQRATRGEILAVGTRAELDAYADALGDLETVTLSASLGRPLPSAAWHGLVFAPWARRVGADVLLQLAANRRLVWSGGAPTVAVVHDLATCVVGSKHGSLHDAYVRHVVVRALRRQTSLVTVSEATRRDVARFASVPSASVRVVANGVDTERFRPRRVPSGLDRPYLLYPARLEHPGKNHVGLLEGFASSRTRRTHALFFVGEDWGARAMLERRVAQMGLSRAVRFFGRVPLRQFLPLLAGAATVAMVGLYEGFGLPALEALACGVPVLASDQGALPEVVGSLGVLCNPYSSMSIASGLDRAVSERHRERVRAAGPEWAKRYSWDATASGLFEACRDVAEDR